MARLVVRVSATLPVSTEFACKTCGYLAFAQVMVAAEGSAPAASHHDEQAKAKAQAIMKASADTQGKHFISLAKCPKCQRANVDAHKAADATKSRGTAVGAVLLVAGLILLGVATEVGPVAGIPGVLSSAFGMIFVLDARKTAKLGRDKSAAVEFLG